MKKHLSIAGLSLLALLTVMTTVPLAANEDFVPPKVFLQAFNEALEIKDLTAAQALVQTYPKIAQFFHDNRGELNLPLSHSNYLQQFLKKNGQYQKTGDAEIKRLLIGQWKTKNRPITIEYRADGHGGVKYPTKSYPFTWQIRNSTIHFAFDGETTSDRIISISKKQYLYKSGETGQLEFVVRDKSAPSTF